MERQKIPVFTTAKKTEQHPITPKNPNHFPVGLALQTGNGRSSVQAPPAQGWLWQTGKDVVTPHQFRGAPTLLNGPCTQSDDSRHQIPLDFSPTSNEAWPLWSVLFAPLFFGTGFAPCVSDPVQLSPDPQRCESPIMSAKRSKCAGNLLCAALGVDVPFPKQCGCGRGFVRQAKTMFVRHNWHIESAQEP